MYECEAIHMGSKADHVKKSCKSFHKDVMYKVAVKVAVAQEDMIKCMFENPRFGNLQEEEEEYFSGSIVDSIKDQDRVSTDPAPMLNRSNFYHEERLVFMIHRKWSFLFVIHISMFCIILMY